MEVQDYQILDQHHHEQIWCPSQLLEALERIPLLALTGITPDISIILLFTFYQPVFYATYDQHFPSESEERAGYWVGFGEHCGDAMTHKILDNDTQKIIYRSAVRPKKSSTPNHRLAPHGGEVSASSDPSEDKISSGSPLGSPEGSSIEQKAPTVFIRSRDEENPSGSKPMPTFDPSDLIGRTFLLPPEENGERHRAKVTRQVVEIIDQDNGQRIENINFILDIGNGKVEELISYNQLLEHLENAQDHDMGMDQELYRFRAIMIQFPPEMDENWVRYGLAKLGQISELPNWQRMLFCAYTTQLLHSTGEVCWNNKDSYFIWFEFVCRNSGQIASRRSWKRSCLGLEYTSKCSRLALLWEPN